MRPLLACNAPKDLSKLPYPLFSSEKLDGIRCIIKDGVAYSRNLKPIRNTYIQSILGRPELNGLDGELIVGDPNASDCMRVTNSGVMSADGQPDFRYYVFDLWDRFYLKYSHAIQEISKIRKHNPYITILSQRLCNNAAEVENHETEALDAGYEGLILRRPDAPYKYGRSTLREAYLIKLKRYTQEEAVVIGYEPLYHNENESEKNALGYNQRSSAKSGKIELPLLGALIVLGKYNDTTATFSIGTGFTLNERERLWLNRHELINKIVSYKFFPIGSWDRPRHPVFVSFRSEDDM